MLWKHKDLERLIPFCTGMGFYCFQLAVGPSHSNTASNSIASHLIPAKVGHVAWLSAPLHGCSLRHRAHGALWSPLGAQDRATQGVSLAYQSQDEGPSATSTATATGPPPELFQNALSALDLFNPSSSAVTDNIDAPEEIAVDHGQTAASVGRAIYEV